MYAIGDSHVNFLFKDININKLSYPSLYIHRFYELGLNFRNYGIPEGSIVILSAGEVDARCLIHKQIHEKNRDEDSVISDLVSKYLSIIERNKNYDIYVLSVLPTINDYDFGHEYSTRGTREDRKRYTEKLNKLLKDSLGQKFMDIYEMHLDKEQGILKLDLSNNGDVHVHDNTLMKKFFNEFLEQRKINYIFQRKINT